MKNFLPGEKDLGLTLLNSFIFINNELTDKLFCSAFHSLSRHVCGESKSYREAKNLWSTFCRTAIITRVTGERPNDTDSSFRFVRLLRQKLEISESQCLNPKEALDEINCNPTRPVVFVDDFLGSGEQFTKTWNREYKTGGTAEQFSAIAASNKEATFYYVTIAATEFGHSRLRNECPEVTVEAAHILDSSYSLIHPDCRMLSELQKKNIREDLARISQRAEFNEYPPFGFNNLALGIAFESSVPDATLPHFHEETKNWKPLFKRS